MTSIDERALQQRREHLVHANQARATRARLKQDLRSRGRVASAHRLADLLADQDQTVMGLRAQAMLLAVRGIGPAKARTILRAADITIGTTRIAQLSPRQRQMITQLLQTVQ